MSRTNVFSRHELLMNDIKTKIIQFRNTGTICPIEVNAENGSITSVEATKFLGLFIDSKLSWKVHTIEQPTYPNL
jgi:hypothetical protein